MHSIIRQSPRVSRVRAFTLIELLTVIAIIGILAAIIIPTVGRVRASARTVTCKSNLRQIAIAALMFADERGFYPPSRAVQNGGSGVAASDNNNAGSLLWPQTLRPYLGSKTQLNADKIYGTGNAVGVCPGRLYIPPVAEETNLVSYAAHPAIMVDDSKDSAGIGKKPLRQGAVPRPTQVILFADAAQQTQGGAQSNFYNVTEATSTVATDSSGATPIATSSDEPDPTSKAIFRYRHPGDTINVAFVDGHVGQFKKGEILGRNVHIGY
ncbi:N-terminal cleavage protein [Opitutaceae bacterium TAV5]|nr:N-terminal cleavage protein [Opitutaceae bacterium TAV5]